MIGQPIIAIAPVLLPLANSVLIDAAAPGVCLPIDQLGKVRPQEGPCDIGAIELDADLPYASGFELPSQ